MEVGKMNNQETIVKSCQICNEMKVKGITLYTTFICSECEKEMIQTEPGDEKYQFFIEKLRVINQLTQYS
jgi:hypothetical protein